MNDTHLFWLNYKLIIALELLRLDYEIFLRPFNVLLTRLVFFHISQDIIYPMTINLDSFKRSNLCDNFFTTY